MAALLPPKTDPKRRGCRVIGMSDNPNYRTSAKVAPCPVLPTSKEAARLCGS